MSTLACGGFAGEFRLEGINAVTCRAFDFGAHVLSS
jgi:hypothetical protein